MPNLMHGAVESSFAGERARNLWRIDPLQGKLYLLLVSPAKPDLQGLAQQFGVPGQSGETRDYGPLLGRIRTGSVWRFRLTANPTKSCAGGDGTGRGAVHAHVSTQDVGAAFSKGPGDRGESARFRPSVPAALRRRSPVIHSPSNRPRST